MPNFKLLQEQRAYVAAALEKAARNGTEVDTFVRQRAKCQQERERLGLVSRSTSVASSVPQWSTPHDVENSHRQDAGGRRHAGAGFASPSAGSRPMTSVSLNSLSSSTPKAGSKSANLPRCEGCDRPYPADRLAHHLDACRAYQRLAKGGSVAESSDRTTQNVNPRREPTTGAEDEVIPTLRQRGSNQRKEDPYQRFERQMEEEVARRDGQRNQPRPEKQEQQEPVSGNRSRSGSTQQREQPSRQQVTSSTSRFNGSGVSATSSSERHGTFEDVALPAPGQCRPDYAHAEDGKVAMHEFHHDPLVESAQEVVHAGKEEKRVECNVCGRKLAVSRMPAHQAACQKQQDKKNARTVDMAAKRKELLVQQNGEFSVSNDSTAKMPKKPSWREQSKHFINAMKAGRGEVVEELPDPRVQCPNCGRKFNEDVAAKHIPKCNAKPVASFR